MGDAVFGKSGPGKQELPLITRTHTEKASYGGVPVIVGDGGSGSQGLCVNQSSLLSKLLKNNA